jgi:hypothetical protein
MPRTSQTADCCIASAQFGRLKDLAANLIPNKADIELFGLPPWNSKSKRPVEFR